MPRQELNWTCSVCAFTWVVNATGTDPNLTRDRALEIIGYPDCCNETYGLTSATCLLGAYEDVGLAVQQLWVTFDQAYALASVTTGQLSGGAWYHHVAVRGVRDGALWIANSAPGYCGVEHTLSREQFNALGPFAFFYLLQPQPQ